MRNLDLPAHRSTLPSVPRGWVVLSLAIGSWAAMALVWQAGCTVFSALVK